MLSPALDQILKLRDVNLAISLGFIVDKVIERQVNDFSCSEIPHFNLNRFRWRNINIPCLIVWTVLHLRVKFIFGICTILGCFFYFGEGEEW